MCGIHVELEQCGIYCPAAVHDSSGALFAEISTQTYSELPVVAPAVLLHAGTLVAVMLGRLYGLLYSTALRHKQAHRDARVYPQGVRSCQGPVQHAQVSGCCSL